MTTTTDDAVQVRFCSAKLITATVLDADGVAWWITWTRHSDSWECSCGEVGNRCAHVLAVIQVTKGNE